MNDMTWTATLTDRAHTPAHSGTVLARVAQDATATAKQGSGFVPASVIAGVPSAYVADQESHPPRGPVV